MEAYAADNYGAYPSAATFNSSIAANGYGDHYGVSLSLAAAPPMGSEYCIDGDHYRLQYARDWHLDQAVGYPVEGGCP
jgi:hypothetical protein